LEPGAQHPAWAPIGQGTHAKAGTRMWGVAAKDDVPR
jgi:hypothetical protein